MTTYLLVGKFVFCLFIRLWADERRLGPSQILHQFYPVDHPSSVCGPFALLPPRPGKKLMSVSFSNSAVVSPKMQWLGYICFVQVRVTSMFNNTGVVEDSVFFSLDSLLLPTHYQPAPGHVVNLVMVESTQSLYCWRALCMAPWDYRYQQRCL